MKDFVPLFVHRFARERLRALGQVRGTIAKDVPEVLFGCVQNAGAAKWPPRCSISTPRGRVHVRSAGSAPADQINPAVVAAMSEGAKLCVLASPLVLVGGTRVRPRA